MIVNVGVYVYLMGTGSSVVVVISLLGIPLRVLFLKRYVYV